MKRALKRVLYGTIPYYFTRLAIPNSPCVKEYKYIKEYGYARHLFNFRHEYQNIQIDVHEDQEKGLHYILHKGNKRLYFQRNLTVNKIQNMYRELLIEQDIRSAHHYIDDISEVKGRTFLDIGSAEGFSALDLIEEVKEVYLFEQDENWIEALNATFEPWKEKVTIVRKYISDYNDKDHQTLDDFFKNKTKENLFLKMDIEGEERKALLGSTELFQNASNLRFAICTYHLNDDKRVISSFLDKYGCTYTDQVGFFRHKLRSVVLRGCK